jgi:hypothetical protein
VAFEYPTPKGIVRLIRSEIGWLLDYAGQKHGEWRTPDDAARAVARHSTGLPQWDLTGAPVPGDLLDWRPLGDSL